MVVAVVWGEAIELVCSKGIVMIVVSMAVEATLRVPTAVRAVMVVMMVMVVMVTMRVVSTLLCCAGGGGGT
jgi:hypothetical protein